MALVRNAEGVRWPGPSPFARSQLQLDKALCLCDGPVIPNLGHRNLLPLLNLLIGRDDCYGTSTRLHLRNRLIGRIGTDRPVPIRQFDGRTSPEPEIGNIDKTQQFVPRTFYSNKTHLPRSFPSGAAPGGKR